MKLITLFFVFMLCALKVHAMPTDTKEKNSLRSVGGRSVAHNQVESLNEEDRALLYGYGDDYYSNVYYLSYDCGPLYEECSTVYVCCELTGGGIAVYLLVTLAIVAGIVACSCACCPCCPWYEKMCCAARARNAAATPVAASSGKIAQSATTAGSKEPEVKRSLRDPVVEEATTGSEPEIPVNVVEVKQ